MQSAHAANRSDGSQSCAVKLMRHSEIEEGADAMKHYVKATSAANVEAMQKLIPKTSKD